MFTVNVSVLFFFNFLTYAHYSLYDHLSDLVQQIFLFVDYHLLSIIDNLHSTFQKNSFVAEKFRMRIVLQIVKNTQIVHERNLSTLT